MIPTNHPTAAVVPLTRARVQLFHLVDAVLDGTTPRVVLSHRDRGDDVVLIARAELEKLERDLAALRAQVGVGPLRGLATLHAPLEQIMTAVRGEQRALAAQKLAVFEKPDDTAHHARAAERRPRGYGGKRRPR